MTTRADLYAPLASRLGGYEGTLSGGGLTGAVLSGLIGSGDGVGGLTGAQLVMPQAEAGDQMRVLTGWEPGTGQAAWEPARTVATAGDEPYLLLPPDGYTLAEIHAAANECLRTTRRSVRTCIPTIEDLYDYRLAGALPWIEAADDVKLVTYRRWPVLNDNEDFTQWRFGPAAAPTGWTLTGDGAIVTRGYIGASLRALVTTGPAEARLRCDFGLLDGSQALADNNALRGETVVGEMQCSGAAGLLIGITDGITTTWSQPTADAFTTTLRVEHTMADTATEGTGIIRVPPSSGASFPWARFSRKDEEVPDYPEPEQRLRGRGSVSNQDGPVVALQRPLPAGYQLVVHSTQPFPTVAGDDAVSDCPRDVWLYGTLYNLFARPVPHQDRTRLDAQAGRYRRTWLKRARRLLDIPEPEPNRPVTVRTR